ncbi:MAG: hypothetical protein RIQ60_1629 [Pseudomonadota bacterium]|jgi:hypothetical protein
MRASFIHARRAAERRNPAQAAAGRQQPVTCSTPQGRPGAAPARGAWSGRIGHIGWLALLCCGLVAPAARAASAPTGELRLVQEDRQPAAGTSAGPLAAANALQPGTAALVTQRRSAELELRQHLGAPYAGHTFALDLNAQAWAQREVLGDSPDHPGADLINRRADTGSGLRVNELHASADLGAWQLSGGKKVVSWDVGFGFRPNDLVQQEARRASLLPTPLQGRPLLMAEHFEGADDALAIVWVHPGQRPGRDERQRGAQEQALALRVYHRNGAVDWHGFARQGEHTGVSLGSAAAWVASDALELHGSLRWSRRQDGWVYGGSGAAASSGAGSGTPPGALFLANPWQQVDRGPATQLLLGGQWTGETQLSLLVEAWHDGAALSNAEWRAWQARNEALGAATNPAPAAARAGNLAWQATPLGGGGNNNSSASANLRRDTLLVRLAWQPGAWLASLDSLVTPADHGRMDSAALQWRGERWRLNAAYRQAGGPADALFRQLPVRRTLTLQAGCAF